MIIVKGAIPVMADRRDEALELISHLARRSRTERGCLDYDVCVRLDQPNTVVLFQQWRDIDALERHFASGHVEEFIDTITDLIEGDVESIRFEVLSEQVTEDTESGAGTSRPHLCERTTLH